MTTDNKNHESLDVDLWWPVSTEKYLSLCSSRFSLFLSWKPVPAWNVLGNTAVLQVNYAGLSLEFHKRLSWSNI